MLIILVMFLLGIILGFIGAGGAGFVIALLTLLFHVPIHTALGTSLAGMAFTSLSGAYSHYREGNIQMKIGLTVGCFAAVGSFFGAKLTSFIPADLLHYLTAGMLFLSAILILIRLFLLKEKAHESKLSFNVYESGHFRNCSRRSFRHIRHRVGAFYSNRFNDYAEPVHPPFCRNDNACDHPSRCRRRHRIYHRRICRLCIADQSSGRHNVRCLCRREIHQPHAKGGLKIGHLLDSCDCGPAVVILNKTKNLTSCQVFL